MKNKLKIITVLILIAILICCSITFASAAAEIKNIGAYRILPVILWVGYAIALGMVVIIGIKYILGAAEAKANMKSAIVNWLIGAFLVFGLSTVIGIVTGIIGGTNTPSDIIDAANGSTSSTTQNGTQGTIQKPGKNEGNIKQTQ